VVVSDWRIASRQALMHFPLVRARHFQRRDRNRGGSGTRPPRGQHRRGQRLNASLIRRRTSMPSGFYRTADETVRYKPEKAIGYATGQHFKQSLAEALYLDCG
jgi:hypothetical protein